MRSGYYFEAIESSTVSTGDVLFRYRAVQHEQKKSQPIYLAIQQHEIKFFIHPETEEVKEKDSPTKPTIPSHNIISRFPLSSNLAVTDELTSKINSCRHATFSFSQRGLGEYKIKSPHKGSYSDLGIIENQDENNLLHSRLLLDFLFDLEHSEIFKLSPFYEEVEIKLKENFLFAAIAAKSRYLYYRSKIFDKYKPKENTQPYIDEIIPAEKQWLNILRNQDAYTYFSNSPWFDTLETEYEDVLFNREYPRNYWINFNENKNENEKLNLNILRESAKWFLRRYNFTNGMRSLFSFYDLRYAPLIGLIIFLLLGVLIFSVNSENHNIVAILTYAALGLIPATIIFMIFFYRLLLPILSALLPRLLMAITSGWILFFTTEELIKTSFDLKFDVENFWVFLFLIPVGLFMGLEINNLAPEIKTLAVIKRSFYIITLGLIYSLLIGSFFTNTLQRKLLERSGYLEEFLISSSTLQDGFEVPPKLIAQAIVNLRMDSFPAYDSKSSEENISNIYPAFSSLPNDTKSKILFLYELDTLNQHTEPFDSSCIAIIAMDKVKQNISFYDSLQNIKYDNVLADDNQLMYAVPINLFGWEITKLYMFPGELLIRSFFVLFLGIFIQLIFEDKPITEPL